MKETRIYRCDDTPEAIFTAVYDAGKSAYGHDHIRLEVNMPEAEQNYTLFSEYVDVVPDPEKMTKVLRTVRRQISQQAYEYIMVAAGSRQPDKADVIYHFIVYGFALGSKVTEALHVPCVQRIFEIYRKARNEAHYFLEFIRFEEISWQDHPVLYAVIEPENEVIDMVADHFTDRLNPEWFIVYDKIHGKAAFHNPGRKWYLRRLEPEERQVLDELEHSGGQEYADLWKAFFDSIAIKERENTGLQRTNLPLHYRKHMTEFQGSSN